MRAKIVRLLAMVRPWIAFSRAGVKAPRATSVGRPPILKIKGDVKIGARAHFRTVQLRPRIAVDRGATLTLGDDVFLNEGATIWASESVTIGDRVLMGNLSTIYDTNAHEVRPGEGVRTAPVVIEDDVWIGRGALVLPGVTIGKGSVIGSQAIVTKDVPPGSIVVGPAATVAGTVDGWETYRRPH